jgi:pimeloyl-ACP methyl ester carboxylesterase
MGWRNDLLIPVSRSFDASDGTFHYLDWGGKGPPAHFSHATGLCAGAYTPLIGELDGRLHFLGMDDRGHGRTRAAADPKKLKSWNTFASDLAFFFEQFDKPVIAMGHSRGAVASLLLAVRRPDLISALVLIDPTILPLSWMWWWYLAKKTGVARWVPIAATAARRRYRWPNRESILENYRQKTVFRSWQEGFLEAYVDYGTEPAEDGGIQLCCHPAWEARAFATCNHDVWRYIHRIEQPTLLLFGDTSDICLPAAVKRFARCAPHAEIRALERTSHFVPMERPREVATAITAFLNRCGVAMN